MLSMNKKGISHQSLSLIRLLSISVVTIAFMMEDENDPPLTEQNTSQQCQNRERVQEFNLCRTLMWMEIMISNSKTDPIV